jgi:hypothetical protein
MAVPLYKHVLAATCLLYPRTDIFHGEGRMLESQHAALPNASQSNYKGRLSSTLPLSCNEILVFGTYSDPHGHDVAVE